MCAANVNVSIPLRLVVVPLIYVNDAAPDGRNSYKNVLSEYLTQQTQKTLAHSLLRPEICVLVMNKWPKNGLP